MEVLAQKAVREKDGSIKLKTVCHWVESEAGGDRMGACAAPSGSGLRDTTWRTASSS